MSKNYKDSKENGLRMEMKRNEIQNKPGCILKPDYLITPIKYCSKPPVVLP